VLRLLELLSHPGPLPDSPHYFGENVIAALPLHPREGVDEVVVVHSLFHS
jgi:hypothetical protein